MKRYFDPLKFVEDDLESAEKSISKSSDYDIIYPYYEQWYEKQMKKPKKDKQLFTNNYIRSDSLSFKRNPSISLIDNILSDVYYEKPNKKFDFPFIKVLIVAVLLAVFIFLMIYFLEIEKDDFDEYRYNFKIIFTILFTVFILYLIKKNN